MGLVLMSTCGGATFLASYGQFPWQPRRVAVHSVLLCCLLAHAQREGRQKLLPASWVLGGGLVGTAKMGHVLPLPPWQQRLQSEPVQEVRTAGQT